MLKLLKAIWALASMCLLWGVGKLFRYFCGGFPSRPFIHNASRGGTFRFVPPPKSLFHKAKPF
jgi:hypothetical protein